MTAMPKRTQIRLQVGGRSIAGRGEDGDQSAVGEQLVAAHRDLMPASTTITVIQTILS